MNERKSLFAEKIKCENIPWFCFNEIKVVLISG